MKLEVGDVVTLQEDGADAQVLWLVVSPRPLQERLRWAWVVPLVRGNERTTSEQHGLAVPLLLPAPWRARTALLYSVKACPVEVLKTVGHVVASEYVQDIQARLVAVMEG